MTPLTAGTLNINEKIELTSPKCPKARTWLIVSMISDKIKFGEDKSIIGKPRNKPKNTKIIIIVFMSHLTTGAYLGIPH